MVTFVTLFLWLMTDVHPVQVAVDDGVASVEIMLDGRTVGVATAPSWDAWASPAAASDATGRWSRNTSRRASGVVPANFDTPPGSIQMPATPASGATPYGMPS